MFTGIVEEVGQIISLQEKKNAWELRIANPFSSADGLEQGASISVNGCCLTLCKQASEVAIFELLEETLQKTNLDGLSKGSMVNLERALPANGRLGGHFVSGHVDACGKIQIFEEQGKNLYLQVEIPESKSRYLVDKGSIAVNGCSLTVCDVLDQSFAVWLIPHTLAKTNLASLKTGEFLNLEFDMLAKYVEKLVTPTMENLTR
ncbi:MAG: riboflavin synthase [Verrucomicrobiota bacterium]|nr:riboflavin synthase [Verrucomicrobiota bacterium]